jgi:hypothetical protein
MTQITSKETDKQSSVLIFDFESPLKLTFTRVWTLVFSLSLVPHWHWRASKKRGGSKISSCSSFQPTVPGEPLIRCQQLASLAACSSSQSIRGAPPWITAACVLRQTDRQTTWLGGRLHVRIRVRIGVRIGVRFGAKGGLKLNLDPSFLKRVYKRL